MLVQVTEEEIKANRPPVYNDKLLFPRSSMR